MPVLQAEVLTWLNKGVDAAVKDSPAQTSPHCSCSHTPNFLRSVLVLLLPSLLVNLPRELYQWKTNSQKRTKFSASLDL